MSIFSSLQSCYWKQFV